MSHNNTDWIDQSVADLVRHEGFREFAYPDPLSKIAKRKLTKRWGFEPADLLLQKYDLNWRDGVPWTVGYGFTKGVTPNTYITKDNATKLLTKVMLEHTAILDKVLPQWKFLPLFAKTVVVNMAFNLGSRLLQFKNSMALIGAGKYEQAASNLRKSLWAKQVGKRADELISRLERRAIAKEHLVV